MGRKLESITGRGSLSETLARSPTMQLPWIGYRIFKWLLLVTSVLLVSLIAYAWATYPGAADVQAVIGGRATVEERVAATETLRAAWVTSIRDLGQMFVLTPLLPLIGAVIGYIFGVSRQEKAPGSGDGAGRPPGTPDPIEQQPGAGPGAGQA